jgi:hypothetical protein
MKKMISLTVVAGLLAFGSASAKADHDRHLRYVVGGAVVGAAVGGLIYASREPHVHHYYYAPAPAPRVVYYTPAPLRATFVPPGHARKGRGKKRSYRAPERVVHVYYAR